MAGSRTTQVARLCALLLVMTTAGFTATTSGGAAQAVTPLSAQAPLPKPILLSDSHDAGVPSVGVEDDGTGHITWTETDAEGDDEVKYCRLPRGATACERTETFLAPGGARSFESANVVLPGDGRVQVVAYFCCGAVDGTYLFESLDGGDSFLPARQIGTASTDYSIAGPGDNAITTMEDASSAATSAAVQVAETDVEEVTSGKAYVGDSSLQQWYAGGVGLIDSADPIAAFTDLDDTFVRQYNPEKGTGYNDVDNWGDTQTVVGENEPTLVTGAAGTFVMTHIEYDNNPLKDAYQVRRISADDGTLSNPFVASDISESIFGTMTADDEGGLTAIWTDAGDTAAIRSSYAVNATSFTPPGTLVEGVRAFNLKLDTAGDGGGFVVWDDNKAPDGSAFVAPIPVGGAIPDTDPPVEPPKNVGGFTPANNTPNCMRKVTIKPGVVAAARSGCFDKDGANGWVSKADVNVNGIDFVTGGKQTTVRINTATNTISAGPGVVQKAGPIIFAKDAGTWYVDKETKFGGLEKAKIRLFDFPVLGEASVKFFNNKAEVTVNLGLPKPFDNVTGQSVLTTTQAKGLILTGITLRAKNLTIGEFGVRDLVVKYDAGLSVFSGVAELSLPPSGSFFKVRVGFKSGKLVVLAFTYVDGEPFPYLIYPGVWLTGFGFGYDGTDGFAIGGGVNLGIPVPKGAITIEAIGDPPGTGGGFRFAIPDSKPYAEMSLSGDLKIFGFKLGRSTAYFNTSGYFDFTSTLAIGYPRLGVRGLAKGVVNAKAGTFYTETQLEACIGLCVDAKAVLSNIGVAACAGIDFGFVTIGLLVGYVWKDGFVGGTTCDTGAFIPPSPPSGPSNTQVTISSDGSVFVPGSPDVTTYTIDIPGTTGVPNVIVRDGNGGLVVQSDPDAPDDPQQGDKVLLVPSQTPPRLGW